MNLTVKEKKKGYAASLQLLPIYSPSLPLYSCRIHMRDFLDSDFSTTYAAVTLWLINVYSIGSYGIEQFFIYPYAQWRNQNLTIIASQFYQKKKTSLNHLVELQVGIYQIMPHSVDLCVGLSSEAFY